MTGRYVLTSNCLQTGSMHLTRSVRQFLKQNQPKVRFRDEDGEVYEAPVDWAANQITGLGGYYAKRRLGVNEAIHLRLEGEEILLEAASLKPPRPRAVSEEPGSRREAERSVPKVEAGPPKRIRVTPYPKEVLYPHTPAPLEPPGFAHELERLGFSRETGGPPWRFRAALGRRTYSIALLRLGEGNVMELQELRSSGAVRYAGIVAPESLREEALREARSLGVSYVSPEALQKLSRLRSVFPLGALDVERMLQAGRLDVEALEGLENEISGLLGERAAFSAVLLCLAEVPSQKVFLLADVMEGVGEMGLEADSVRQILEVLCGPPFLMLKRLSPGEYLMRSSVEAALEELAQYAQFVGMRLGATVG
ncbi:MULTISPECIES: hypothetical protein [unclassified Meiothermus]|uniref:hypothetical protein n=1 Tax=unclassified Meiothermus TaxID=370471 RepID=UPI000D7C43A0|nr:MULTISPECIES: hypothetical protein [unclassified Meiothermus]PZA06526.1 hypothetical protein DNA98_13165 [Meiothermus sp. Pnk-1]RYM37201.1 hypothetical protein EWH23_06925 [Meiothermus sp. PNK-Is4]